MTRPVDAERARFADELIAVGPDAPTLCGEWTTRDLAAHIILRERRPDAMPGILVPAFAGYTDRVQHTIAEQPFDQLVDDVRSGPPFWNPTALGAVARKVNTIEFFVHLEDVRRAQPAWEPRVLDAELTADLYATFRPMAKQLVRSATVGVQLTPDDGHDPLLAKNDEPMVDVGGPVGELVLWAYGRQAHSVVDYDGEADAIAQLATASFGL